MRNVLHVRGLESFAAMLDNAQQELVCRLCVADREPCLTEDEQSAGGRHAAGKAGLQVDWSISSPYNSINTTDGGKSTLNLSSARAAAPGTTALPPPRPTQPRSNLPLPGTRRSRAA
eukprot:TRINITY_DN3028_c0_g3_i5.p2 TRINITY_DN3028_c0_g3~~TRINITY_DN3028_c0_g3_i5.p2  ORF type:complete len:117 (+),score=6.73 TRINITY_DN3028_c0_g3_i5:136-486(+)